MQAFHLSFQEYYAMLAIGKGGVPLPSFAWGVWWTNAVLMGVQAGGAAFGDAFVKAAQLPAAEAAAVPAHQEAWRLRVLATLVRQGLPAAWLPTVLEAIDTPAMLLAGVQLVKSHLSLADPFMVGAMVMVLHGPGATWCNMSDCNSSLPAAIEAVHEDGTFDCTAVESHFLHVKRSAVIKIDSDSGAAALLRAAASVGATQVVRALLDIGISPFLADRAHYTPLHLAAQHGHAPACKLLVEAKADPFLWDGQLISPAELAQKHGHRRCLHVFRPTPTDEDLTEEVFGSKLMQAAQIGNASRVEELLAEGIKVDESVKNKVTALHVACRGNHVVTADVLAAAGANVDACTTSGITPLILAAEESCIKVVDMLCRMRANPAAVDRHQRSPLSVAAEKGNAYIVVALLDAGAPINHFNERGQTVLTVSCAFGHVEVADTLLQRKADPLLFSDVKGTNRGVDTALIAACRSNSLELVKKLLEVGVDPNHRPPITDKSGNLDPWSPLIESSANGRDAIVSELLMAKANPNMNLKGNASPLYFSACNGHLQSTQLLIKHGAQIDDADLSNGRNGLWWAAKEGHAEIVRYLLDVGASVNHQLHERAERAGTSPLHMAAAHGHVECVSILLEKRADHTLAELKGGNTAMHLAAGGGHCEVIQFLLASGAAKTCRNMAGETAAASAAAAGHERIAAQLANHQCRQS